MRGIAILVGTAALLTGVTVALAQAGSTSGSANNKRIIKAKIVAKSFVRSDVDTAPKGPSEGDYYVFHDRLEDMHGARAGLSGRTLYCGRHREQDDALPMPGDRDVAARNNHP